MKLYRILRFKSEMTLMRAAVALSFCLIMTTAARAQTFTTLHTFNIRDGNEPVGLTQGIDGELYGATLRGGARRFCQGRGCGSLFRITTNGVCTVIHRFHGPNGALPNTPTQGIDGRMYGTTSSGGLHPYSGIMYMVRPEGTLITIHNFSERGGDGPSSLVQADNGNFYATTFDGGPNFAGTIFTASSGGATKRIYDFCVTAGCPDSGIRTTLIHGSDGNFYGTAPSGGVNGGGRVFKVTPGGVFSTLYDFCSKPNCADGHGPIGPLVEIDGVLYGATSEGGLDDAGTVFQLSETAGLKIIHNFCVRQSCADGGNPENGLILGSDGNLYGTTNFGPEPGDVGLIFRINTSGELKTLFPIHSSQGSGLGPLFQATDGNLYGTLAQGPVHSQGGSIYQLTTGLGPFVKTLQTSGSVDSTIIILGTALTGSTSVAFNGTTATFTVVSDSEITATIPAGATTGPITVITPSGTLNSNVPFKISL